MGLEVAEITFTYPDGPCLLQDFSANFNYGAITALRGPNGAGKTTLAKIILGILKAARGRVILDGENLAGLNVAQIGKKIGYVMQNPNQQMFCTTVAQEVEYGLRNLGLDEAEIIARRNYYLDYFQIKAHQDAFPFLLSQGERQRVVLAAVLAMRPAYLLLDEPTSSLDLYRRRLLGEYLRKICHKEGCGIIVISHDEGFMEKYCDETVFISREKEAFYGKPSA